MNTFGKLAILVIAIYFLAKISNGPSTSQAVGQYEVKPTYPQAAPTYQAPLPTKCVTKSWDGPYKHDGRTYSTTCN